MAGRRASSPRSVDDAAPGSELSTKERILAEAARLFHDRGYSQTTMREIAASIGIKASSLYNHFPSKQDILYRLSYDTMRDMLASALDAMSDARDPEARLRAFVRAHTRYCIRERHRARVADELRDLEPEHLRDVIAIRDQYELLLRGILTEMNTSTGAVLDVAITGNAIATMSSAVNTWYRDDGRLNLDEVCALYAELAVRVVTPCMASHAQESAKPTETAGNAARRGRRRSGRD